MLLRNPLLLVPVAGAILAAIVVVIVIFAGGGIGGSESTPTPTATPTATATATPTPTATPTTTPTPTVTSTPTALPKAAVPLGELGNRAKAFVTARGYYPSDPVVTDDGQGHHLLAVPSYCSPVVTVNHVNCQVTHFFLEGTYLGTDTLRTYYGYESVRPLGSGQFAIDYTTYAPDDGECCPSVKATVLYTWTGNGLVSSGEPPLPRGQPFNGEMANQPQPLYIAILDGQYKHFYFIGERILLPAGTPVAISLVDMSSSPTEAHALAIPEIGFRSPDTVDRSPITFQVTFDRPGTYTFHCPYHPDQEHGIIEVVPALTP